MPSSIELDVVSSLIDEPELIFFRDIDCVCELTPIEKSSNQNG